MSGPGQDFAWSADGRYFAVVDHTADRSYFESSGEYPGLRTDHSGDLVRVWRAEDLREWTVSGSKFAFLGQTDELIVTEPSRVGEETGERSGIWPIASASARLTLEGVMPVPSRDGSLVLTHYDNGTGRLLHATDGSPAAPPMAVHNHAYWRHPGQISPGGDRVAFIDDEVVHLFSTDGTRVTTLQGVESTFTDSGRYLLMQPSFDEPGQTDLVDPRLGRLIGSVSGGHAVVSPDERLLATQPVVLGRYWDDPSVAEPAAVTITQLGGPNGLATGGVVRGTGLEFSPDSRLLVTAYDDGRLAIWEAGSAQPVAMLGDLRVLSRDPGGYAGAARPGEPEPTAPDTSRYVEAKHPVDVRPAQEFSVIVGLRLRPIDGSLDAVALPLATTTDAAGERTGAPPLTVRLRPDVAFDVLGAPEATLEVPYDHDEDPVIFTVRARDNARGPHQISAVFWQGPHVLAQLPLVITVNSTSSAALVTRTLERGMRPWDADDSPPADAVVTVERSEGGAGDRINYSYEWVARNWPRIDAGSADIHGSLYDLAAARYKELSKFATDTYRRTPGVADSANSAAAEELARLGANLYRDIVPQPLRRFFSEFVPTGGSLLVYTNDPWIPWEVLNPWGDGMPQEHSDFLCTQIPLARWYYSEGQRPVGTIRARHLIPVLDLAHLPAVQNEWAYLQHLQVTWPPLQLAQPMPFTARDVVRLLSRPDTGLVHFATHGARQSDGASVAFLRLDRDDFNLEYLVGTSLAEGMAAAQPLVVMNACHTAILREGFRRPQGWAQRFLELGSGAFVGANWEVADDLAADFARVLYDHLRAGTGIGEAVRAARSAIRELAPGNSTWLAYSLYAHPNALVQSGQ
jgi:hypothetical protein